MTNLKDVTFGMNQYCGPAVMSALTGRSTDECAAVISKVTSRAMIKAVAMEDLRKAFELLRFDCKKVTIPAYTLFGVLNSLAHADGMYIVGVPKHVVAVEVNNGQIYYIDNHTKQAMPAQGAARLTQRVDCIYKVVPKPLPKFLKSEIRIVDDRNFRVMIELATIYENRDDNTSTNLGVIKYKNDMQLDEIIKALQEFLERR